MDGNELRALLRRIHVSASESADGDGRIRAALQSALYAIAADVDVHAQALDVQPANLRELVTTANTDLAVGGDPGGIAYDLERRLSPNAS